MALIRFGDFLYRAGWFIAGLLLLELPATIFAYSGFFARLTTAFDMVLLGVYSTAIGCLCWLVGRAMGYVLVLLSHNAGKSCSTVISPTKAPSFSDNLARPARGVMRIIPQAAAPSALPQASTAAWQRRSTERIAGWHRPCPQPARRANVAQARRANHRDAEFAARPWRG